MDVFFELKNIQGSLETEITVFGGDFSCENEGGFVYSEADADNFSGGERLDEINGEIARLSCNADGTDYALAAMCGALAGRISPLINKAIKLGYGKDRTKSDGDVVDGEGLPCVLEENGEGVENAEGLSDSEPEGDGIEGGTVDVEAMARECGEDIPEKGKRLSDGKNLLGLILSVSEQFSQSGDFTPDLPCDAEGLPVEINSKGNFVGRNKKAKIFSGVLNWFFKIAREGGRDGERGASGRLSRILTPLIALAGNMSQLPCVNDGSVGDRLYEVFKTYASGERREKFRAELEEIFPNEEKKGILGGKQSSVTLNELLVRAVFFVKVFACGMKEAPSVSLLDFSALMPYKDRTLERMLSVSLGVFMAIDVGRAAVRSLTRGGAVCLPKFFLDMVLKVNVAGVGRFFMTVKNDAEMLRETETLRNERIRLCGEKLAFNCTQVFYRQDKMWRNAENAVSTLTEVSALAERAVMLYVKAVNEMASDIGEIEKSIQSKSENEKDFFGSLSDILRFD